MLNPLQSGISFFRATFGWLFAFEDHMVDRAIVYPAAIPQTNDLLSTNRNTLIGMGMLAQEMFGTATVASGFACTPTAPTSLSVSVAEGRLYSLQEVDPLAYSTLPADTTDLIVKQGIILTASTLPCAPPGTSGQSVNYLVEAAFLEQDINASVLPYYNSANPSQPYSGPNNTGSANYQTRQDTVQIQVKAGTPATTGTQVTPAADTGFVGLWVITVAYGQTTITTGNISQYPGAPLLGGSLLQAIQNNAFTYGADVGVANAYAVMYSPAVTTLVDGMTLEFQAGFANTGASTFSPNGVTAAPLLGGAHAALQGGEIASGSKCVAMWKANLTSWVLLESTGGALQITPGSKSSHAVNLGQFLASLTASGYFELPVIVSGVQKTMIVQWVTTASGAAPAGGGTSSTGINWPIPFPTACLQAMATADSTGWSQNTATASVFNVTNTTFGAILENFGTVTQTGQVRVIGIGY